MSVLRREWGVRRHGDVEPVNPLDANTAYLTPRQLAVMRAKTTGGTVVSRVMTTTYGDWTPGHNSAQTCDHNRVKPVDDAHPGGSSFRCLDCGELSPAEEVTP